MHTRPRTDLPVTDPLFTAETSTTPGHAIVRLHGELDLLTAPQLEAVLDQLLRHGHRHVVLDLSELRFLGATGLAVFVRADTRLAAADGSLSLTGATCMIQRMLSIAGLGPPSPGQVKGDPSCCA